jgi:hypothetical protein
VTATPDVFRGKRADLQDHLFHVGALNLSIRSYSGKAYQFEIRAENTSSGFLKVNPMDLIVVSVEGHQVQFLIACPNLAGGYAFQPSFRMAPGAFVNLRFVGVDNDSLHTPFKVYFGEKQLAEITSE